MRARLGLFLLLAAGCAAEDLSVVEGDASAVDRVDSPRDGSATDVPVGRDATVADAPRSDVATTRDVPVGSDVVAPQDVPSGVQVNAWLELRAMDLWAQSLPEGGFTLEVTRDGAPVTLSTAGSPGLRRAPLTTAATYRVSLRAPGHHPLDLSLRYDGTDRAGGISLTRDGATATHGVSLGHVTREVEGRGAMVHALWLGLRHQWFSAHGRPARRGNALRLLMDGEEAWNAVLADLRQARSTVHASTWWWESDFELFRDPTGHVNSTLDARRRNTALAIFESLPATKRVLVGQFWSMDGSLSTLTSDAALRAHGTTAGDRFEYMGQANPSDGMLAWSIPPFQFADRVRALDPSGAGGVSFDAEPAVASTIAPRNVDLTHWPITLDLNHASYHQKFMVIDDRLAFIGGMNLRRVDWDTSAHRVFEPRRMLLNSTNDERRAVAARDALPDTGPRKDYMLRVEGPSARDAQDVFHRRWRYLLDTNARYSDDASDFTVAPPAAPVAGGVQAQVTATLPAPFHEYAIAESWMNAVSQARSYIFIEDQYFRIPMLTEAIQRRMTEVPTLRLMVVTKPINEWTDPGCAWTYRTHGELTQRFPTRYRLLQLQAFDTQVTWGFDETECRFQAMDTHSKMLIVDDEFMSVGSCNKNNRGILYEAELNVAVHDRAWVTAQRQRIFANMLQRSDVPADVDGWWAAFEAQRLWNDAVRQRWSDEGDDISLDGAPLPASYTPRGFVYTLTPGPVRDCLIEDVGPDVV
ncbi:MAG: phosphatidylserine/phosphatidylglycerophosphate/cardiolipin synthase family protein [Polyangiales bacterium]